MNFYKGVDLDRNANLFNYISTMHPCGNELREAYMEADTSLQRLVKKHHLKISLYKTAFNLSIYAMFYGFSLILTQG